MGQPRTAPATRPGRRSSAWHGADEFDYPDTGCQDLGIPSCMACPLPVCRWDVPRGWQRQPLEGRPPHVPVDAAAVARVAAMRAASQETACQAKWCIRQV